MQHLAKQKVLCKQTVPLPSSERKGDHGVVEGARATLKKVLVLLYAHSPSVAFGATFLSEEGHAILTIHL